MEGCYLVDPRLIICLITYGQHGHEIKPVRPKSLAAPNNPWCSGLPCVDHWEPGVNQSCRACLTTTATSSPKGKPVHGHRGQYKATTPMADDTFKRSARSSEAPGRAACMLPMNKV